LAGPAAPKDCTLKREGHRPYGRLPQLLYNASRLFTNMEKRQTKSKSFEESMKEFMREYAKILPRLPD